VARSGQQRWLRETLAGGWYGLVNLTSIEVYPDFYSALLFTKLMGPEVLAAHPQRTPMPKTQVPGPKNET
jgi:hypothetical protein